MTCSPESRLQAEAVQGLQPRLSLFNGLSTFRPLFMSSRAPLWLTEYKSKSGSKSGSGSGSLSPSYASIPIPIAILIPMDPPLTHH